MPAMFLVPRLLAVSSALAWASCLPALEDEGLQSCREGDSSALLQHGMASESSANFHPKHWTQHVSEEEHGRPKHEKHRKQRKHWRLHRKHRNHDWWYHQMSHMTTAEPSAVAAEEEEQDAGISGFAAAECVTQGVLTCINDKSFYWPKCDPAQAKNIVGPSGYEFGFYCTDAWAATLNQMLSDRAVNKCNDREAILKLLAQVAWETGYFSTSYQPQDGGAGQIHMIPNNWEINAKDMDGLFPKPSPSHVSLVKAQSQNFFQNAEFGWKSTAAWFKTTNRVIPGCGEDLFDQTFARQSFCILGAPSDRTEAYNIVASCLP
ncbi:unnamed protein product [Polarella glacialis]|uniref:Cellulase n=1 Tax=Polarella glacialis TaxID=89957 RepID=A0A813KMQ8_POLGL|nr:unnamed protein product [Polarella glacialis]